MARLLTVGVAWLAAFGLFAALIEWSARPPRPTPTPPVTYALPPTESLCDGEDVPSGVYLYDILSANDEKTGKLIIVR